MSRWAGVDVGGRRKGFHLALVTDDREVTFARAPDPDSALDVLTGWRPRLTGIDSPRAWAPEGARSRPDERDFARRGICGIRYTPDEATADAHPGTYYEWIQHGLELWALLDAAELATVEVFPTASFTTWAGPRANASRAAWTRAAMPGSGIAALAGAEAARSQDHRDALAAALTARQHDLHPHTTTVDGDLVVPAPGSSPLP